MNAPAQAGLPALSLKDPRLFREQCYVDGAWLDADNRWQEGPVIFQFDMSKPETMFVAQAFGIRNDDTIYVTTAPSVEWVKTLQPIALTLSTVRGTISLGGTLEGAVPQ